MSLKKRPDLAKERTRRSLIDALSTRIYDKSGKLVFDGKSNADALMKRVNPLRR